MARKQDPQRSWNDYFIPGAIVLRNKFTGPGKPAGETDQTALTRLEEHHARSRLLELASNPIPGRFDYDHMKAIHRQIFQDVYDWAGQERTAPVGRYMIKDGHAYYPAGPQLAIDANKQYAKIAAADYLRDLDHDGFAAELAERWGEINVIHAFREGNTRAQFVFFSQLRDQAGYRMSAGAFLPRSSLRDEFVAARFHSQDTGDNGALAEVLGRAIKSA